MKTALVTGADQGLGSGFVEHLLDNSWQVFATTRSNSEGLLQHENLTWVTLELTDDQSISQAFSVVSAQTDSLDLLINNAGINKDTATNGQKEKVCQIGSLDRDSLLNMFDVNAVAPLLMTETFLSLLNTEQSFVINVSSCRASFNGKIPNSHGNYGYRASKVALNMYTRCSLFDLPDNVRTFAVHPGSVKSHMNPGGSDVPKEQAEKIISITENWHDELNGQYLNYDGTFYPL